MAARSGSTSVLPVLVVLHQESSTPGRIGNALRALGHRLDIRRPRFGDALPETLDDHAGAVIFGGAISANDPDEYVRRETDWIEVPLREQRPFLGICLGAQMLARQLGAKVAPHPQGRTVDRLLPGAPDGRGIGALPRLATVMSTTGIAKDSICPAAAELLAEGDDFPVQAFRSGHAFGLQFHPDVTYAMMHCWTTRGHDRMDAPGARQRHHHFADRAVHDVTERAWLKHFLDGWLARLPPSVMSEAAE